MAKVDKTPKPSKLKLKSSKVVKTGAKPVSKRSRLRASTAYEQSRKKKSSRLSRAPSSIPEAYLKQSKSSRHVRTRRSIETPEHNATFPAMMHSISIISPIEDFDDKELDAWEKMMHLEAKVEEDQIELDKPKVTPVHHHSPYCFSFVGLVSASALLSSCVLALTLSLHIVFSHLCARDVVQSSKC